MSDTVHLDAYLERIGLGGRLEPALPVLRAVVARHVQAIPFENLDPFLGLPVALDLPALQDKLVRGGRGGYCFEHNLLLQHVLRAIGFRVTGLAARVLWNQPAGAVTPRSHMLLRVDLDGATHLVDAGFGGQTLTGVLRLEAEVDQHTPHGPFRLLHVDGDWLMQSLVAQDWKALYRFDLQPQHPVDYEAINHYLSTHPRSHFVNGLIAARIDGERRLTLRGREFAVHHPDGRTERHPLGSAAAIREALERQLRIVLPRHPQLDQRLDSLP